MNDLDSYTDDELHVELARRSRERNGVSEYALTPTGDERIVLRSWGWVFYGIGFSQSPRANGPFPVGGDVELQAELRRLRS